MDAPANAQATAPPTTPVPPLSSRGSLRPPAPGRRRRRVIVALAIAAVVLVAGAILSFTYVALKVQSIKRIAVAGLHPVGPGSVQTILLTGSDSRTGESTSQAQHFGSAAEVTGQRSDVIVLIRLDPATGKAAMLSIPRDMFVPIAGASSSNRINAAFNNGPNQLIATIQQDFGITVNHYAQEDFTGLQGITDAVGGVCMSFPYPVRDGSPTGTGNESGLDIATAGRHNLNGAMALALVRSRYYLYDVNGAWRADGTADIGRIQRQHSFMRALASKAFHASLTNPFTANAVLGKAVHDVRVDNSFTTLGLIRLALHLRSMHPSAMPSFTMPYRVANNYRQFGDVLLPEPAQDAAAVNAWQSSVAATSGQAATPAPTVAPSSVTVKVLNGSGVAGQARAVADQLHAAGFAVTGYGNSPALVRGATVVAYGPGLKAAAQTVAAHLSGPISLAAQSTAGATVVVTTSSSFAGVTTPPTVNSGSANAGPSAAAGAAAAATDANSIPAWDPRPC
jgi:LCP family protein required for cell wall assembly